MKDLKEKLIEMLRARSEQEKESEAQDLEDYEDRSFAAFHRHNHWVCDDIVAMLEDEEYFKKMYSVYTGKKGE